MRRSELKRHTPLTSKTPLKSVTALKSVTPLQSIKPLERSRESKLKPRTAKRAAEERIYSKLRKQFLIDHPFCACGCGRESKEIQHVEGREGRRLNNTEKWAAVASECHRRIEADPQWAFATGLASTRAVARKEWEIDDAISS